MSRFRGGRLPTQSYANFSWCRGELPMNRITISLATIMAAACFSTSNMRGQEITGTIRGTVLDPSGAGVPAATVKAVQIDTGLERTVISSREGSYVLVELPVGRYRL